MPRQDPILWIVVVACLGGADNETALAQGPATQCMQDAAHIGPAIR